MGHRWEDAEKRAVLRHLENGRLYERHREQAWCRLHCGVEHLGNLEYTDGSWVWPEGLAHDVAVHDVRLPDEFVEHAFRGNEAAAPLSRAVTLEPWVDWGRAQGAWVDLTEPWVPVNDLRQRHALAEELARELPSGHVLEGEETLEVVGRRGDQDDVLFLLRDGRLAIVHLTWAGPREPSPPYPRTRFVASWAEWNEARVEDF